MNNNLKSHSWAIISAFLFLVFAISTPAQKPGPCDLETAYPFDYNDGYYYDKGVIADAIDGRMTGYDKMSVPGRNCDPKFAPVRVLVTVPGYDQFGQPLFWTPLGNTDYRGFTADKKGILARQMAHGFPFYIFPDRNYFEFSTFKNLRQAPVVDNTRYMQAGMIDPNPLGLRLALIVRYTEKAFNTKEGMKVMAYFAEKNGLATDDTPILKSVEDVMFMLNNGFVTAEPYNTGESVSKEMFTVAPNMASKNAVAPDAFVWMAWKDGKPLPAEEMFWFHFDCMKKTGEMCKSETLD